MMNLLSFIFIINSHTRLLNAVCKFVEITRISICGTDNSDTASHLRLIRYYISLICLLSEYWIIVINISHLHVDLYSSTQRRYSKICGYHCQLHKNNTSYHNNINMSAICQINCLSTRTQTALEVKFQICGPVAKYFLEKALCFTLVCDRPVFGLHRNITALLIMIDHPLDPQDRILAASR